MGGPFMPCAALRRHRSIRSQSGGKGGGFRTVRIVPGRVVDGGRCGPEDAATGVNMSSSARTVGKPKSHSDYADAGLPDIAEAEAVLLDLARVFADSPLNPVLDNFTENGHEPPADAQAPNLEAKY